MSTRLAALTLMIAWVVAGMACSGDSTTSSSGTGSSSGSGTCRTFPTAATVNTSALGLTQTLQLTATFNSSTHQNTITTMLPTGSLCTTTVQTYNSNADFVDEVRVIPGVILIAGTTTTNSAACGSIVSTATYSYDSQRRLTQITSGTSATTFTAWDSSGRPTAGSFTGTTITNVYNDTLRTSTQSQVSGGITNVTTTTFDLNGNPQQVVNTTASVLASTTTFTTTATGQVCK